MNKNTKIEATMDVYAVFTNSDLSEGRGYQYILHTCISESTAIRLAKKVNVQGTDGDVIKISIPKINGQWYAPRWLEYPTDEDTANDKDKCAKELNIAVHNKILDKAKKLGLSDEEIKILKNNCKVLM